VKGREAEKGEYILHLERNHPHSSRVSDTTKCEDGVILRKQRLPIQTQHTEVHYHSFRGGHEHPPKVYLDVKPAVPLPFRIQLRNSKQRTRRQILLKHTHEDNRQRSKQRIKHTQAPGLVKTRPRIPDGALEKRLREVEKHFFPKRADGILARAHVVPAAVDKKEFDEEAELRDGVVGGAGGL
jgi:hypothetical protein